MLHCFFTFRRNENVLWHSDPLLSGNREIRNCTAAVARQLPANDNKNFVFYALYTKQQLNGNRGTVFAVRSLLRCYKQENWSYELFPGQSPAGKKVSIEAEDIVGSVTRQ
jgi:hypothetical protein